MRMVVEMRPELVHDHWKSITVVTLKKKLKKNRVQCYRQILSYRMQLGNSKLIGFLINIRKFKCHFI